MIRPTKTNEETGGPVAPSSRGGLPHGPRTADHGPRTKGLHPGGAPGRHRHPGDPDGALAARDQRRHADGPRRGRPVRDQPVGRGAGPVQHPVRGLSPQPGAAGGERQLLAIHGQQRIDHSILPANPTPGWTTSTGTGDITVGQLASRSVSALRKFWPKVQISTGANSPPPNIANSNGTYWYDFNGNGVQDAAYILQGHECLVFFLGGIPLPNPIPLVDPTSATFGVTGFGTDPTNPFSNSIAVTPGTTTIPTRCTAPAGRRRSTSSTPAGCSWTHRTRRCRASRAITTRSTTGRRWGSAAAPTRSISSRTSAPTATATTTPTTSTSSRPTRRSRGRSSCSTT